MVSIILGRTIFFSTSIAIFNAERQSVLSNLMTEEEEIISCLRDYVRPPGTAH